MESNKLYEVLLSLPFIVVTNVEISKKELHINCESQLESGHCPNCLCQCTEVNQSQERILQDLSISGRKVYLHLKSRQFICEDCNRFFYERFHFASKYERMTIRYEDFIYHRCIGVDLSYVSRQEDLCWATVNRIFEKWSTKKIALSNLLSGG